ncbi:MAG: hypothetical protein ISR65_01930 [Bacteriovoracaceae bacterium]|nr:hypothetical protein [Bacteriovoracaceae bacterium]
MAIACTTPSTNNDASSTVAGPLSELDVDPNSNTAVLDISETPNIIRDQILTYRNKIKQCYVGSSALFERCVLIFEINNKGVLNNLSVLIERPMDHPKTLPRFQACLLNTLKSLIFRRHFESKKLIIRQPMSFLTIWPQ